MRALAAVLALLLAGCAGMPETRTARVLEPGAPVALAPGEAVVFGSILFVENGKPKYPYGLGKPMWFIEGLHGNWPHFGADKDGAFYLALPAGRYQIRSVVPFYYTPYICAPYRFEALESGRAYYVGALRIEFESTVMLGGLWGNYIDSVDYAEVLDRFDAAAAAFAARNPGAARLPLDKAMMARIPGKRVQLGTQCR